MTAYEVFAVEAVRAGAVLFDVYPSNTESRARFAEWRLAKGR